MATFYQRVHWISGRSAQDPHTIFSEVVDGIETRKVEIFDDGRRQFADTSHQVGETFLAEGKIPPPDEIQKYPEFSVELMKYSEFRQLWGETYRESEEQL